MIKILLVAMMAICGLIQLLLPEDKLVNKDKIKPDQDVKEIIKKTRTSGIISLIFAVLFFFIM